MQKHEKTTTNQPAQNGGLVNAESLLEILFPDERSRPSLRFIRSLQAKRRLPYYKVGRLVFFDVGEARAAIIGAMRVSARGEVKQ